MTNKVLITGEVLNRIDPRFPTSGEFELVPATMHLSKFRAALIHDSVPNIPFRAVRTIGGPFSSNSQRGTFLRTGVEDALSKAIREFMSDVSTNPFGYPPVLSTGESSHTVFNVYAVVPRSEEDIQLERAHNILISQRNLEQARARLAKAEEDLDALVNPGNLKNADPKEAP